MLGLGVGGVSLGVDDQDVGVGAVCDPELGTVENVVVAARWFRFEFGALFQTIYSLSFQLQKQSKNLWTTITMRVVGYQQLR